jgi:DNA segregation ATPase FtsK/SpoIIIE, S-DNA-T family
MAARRRRTYARRKPRTYRKRRTARKPINFEIESHIAREIWAVLYLALAALTWLSLNQQLGAVGEAWASVLEPIFGIGMGAVPFALVFMGASVFFSKKITWGLARLTGLLLLAVAILGFVHMSVPEAELLEVAQRGEGGGYIGFVASFLFMSAFGNVGAYVLLTATFLIGVLLTLQISLGAIMRFVTPSTETMKKVVSVATPEINVVDSKEEQSEVKIVKPDYFDEKDEAAMAIKEVSKEEIEARLKKEKAEKKAKEPEGDIVMVDKQMQKDSKWEFPSLDLLSKGRDTFTLDQSELKRKADLIQSKLEQFGISVAMHEVHVGPTVVQYTLKPAAGVKLSKITSLKNDLALALAAPAVRIEAPIPGRSLVGIEIPNISRATVYMREMMETEAYKKFDAKLKISLGRDVSGNSIVADLEKMPHLLISGATGAGKSVGLNSFLISLLYNNSPNEMKLILIDPKQVELSSYNGLPHLLTPVIKDPEKAATALRWAVAEMNRRYKVCAEAGHRNIADYNKDKKTTNMPRIVLVIDELADLMMQAQKEVEASICRVAQMARAVGIHLIIATQRPSVDVITGLIKANIPTRIAFTVTSSVDSRTILDMQGAEDLLGAGDMLYLSGTMAKPVRIQGIYISPKEIEKITNKLKLTDDEIDYDEGITSKEVKKAQVQGVPDVPENPKSDEDLMAVAIECLKNNRKAASTSSLQRYLKIGYSRAARIVDMMEEAGVVGPAKGSKPRDVFLKEQD